jgi:hypothetical protein
MGRGGALGDLLPPPLATGQTERRRQRGTPQKTPRAADPPVRPAVNTTVLRITDGAEPSRENAPPAAPGAAFSLAASSESRPRLG